MTRLAPGTRLGAYEIIGEVGSGGMGTVYRARDTRLPRDAAIKIAAERFNERFERGAQFWNGFAQRTALLGGIEVAADRLLRDRRQMVNDVSQH